MYSVFLELVHVGGGRHFVLYPVEAESAREAAAFAFDRYRPLEDWWVNRALVFEPGAANGFKPQRLAQYDAIPE